MWDDELCLPHELACGIAVMVAVGMGLVFSAAAPHVEHMAQLFGQYIAPFAFGVGWLLWGDNAQPPNASGTNVVNHKTTSTVYLSLVCMVQIECLDNVSDSVFMEN